MTFATRFRKSIEYQVVEELSRSVRWDANRIVVNTDAERLAGVCEALAKAGGIFDSAVLSSPASTRVPQVCYAFRMPDLGLGVSVFARGKNITCLSTRLDAAAWDERKIKDLAGVQLDGLEDARPLLAHPESGWGDFAEAVSKNRQTVLKPSEAYASREYAMEGTGADGEFEIPVGPVHAGIIEPGHFRFFVGGEDIHRMETRMFYLHRGLERQAVGRHVQRILPLIEQVSGDESVANAVAFAQAVEDLEGIRVPERAESLRLVLLELERIYSHLADLGGMATDVGFYASSSQFLLLREEMMRQNAALSGDRFLRGVVSIGGVDRNATQENLDATADALASFSKAFDELESMTLSSSTFLDRVFTTGKVSAFVADELALVGPVARASGKSCDLRRHFPYGAYKKRAVCESMAASGDVLARFNVKANEVKESARLIRSEINQMPSGPTHTGEKRTGHGFGWGWCEAPRGSCSIFVRTDKGRISRLSIRTASFRNWRGLERAVNGNIVPDFPLINKSFNLSYAGTDL